MTLAKAQQLVRNLDNDMVLRWHRMFNCVFDQLGADLIQLNEGKPLTAPQVRELCADADRPLYNGNDKLAAATFSALTRNNQEAVLMVVFPPGQTYGY